MKKRVYPDRSKKVVQMSVERVDGSYYFTFTEVFKRRSVSYRVVVSLMASITIETALTSSSPFLWESELAFFKMYARRYGDKTIVEHDSYLL